MTKFSGSIRINAPKDRVWNIISDLGGVYKYNPSVHKSYYASDTHSGVGADRVCELLPMGKLKESVLEWREGESYRLSVIPLEKAPPLTGAEGGFRLKAEGQSTVAHFEIEYQLKFSWLGRLMDVLLVRPQFSKTVPGILEGLKHYAETGEEVTPQVLERIQAQQNKATPQHA